MHKHMAKVVIKILQGNEVTQTILGGLTIYPMVANFQQCICVKIIKKCLAVDSYCKNKQQGFLFGLPCRHTIIVNMRVIFHKRCLWSRTSNMLDAVDSSVSCNCTDIYNYLQKQ